MGSKKKGRNRPSSKQNRYTAEFKCKAVKLYVEEGYPVAVVAEELGIGKSTLSAWARRYREDGLAGLERRISHLLRRAFHLQASPETVRKTLKEHDLVEKPKPKPKRNPARPRFFERARPNQLWQTDIFTFRLGGRNALGPWVFGCFGLPAVSRVFVKYAGQSPLSGRVWLWVRVVGVRLSGLCRQYTGLAHWLALPLPVTMVLSASWTPESSA